MALSRFSSSATRRAMALLKLCTTATLDQLRVLLQSLELVEDLLLFSELSPNLDGSKSRIQYLVYDSGDGRGNMPFQGLVSQLAK